MYAIEASSLADWTEIVVATNKLSDVIKVIKCQVEDLTFEMIDNAPVDVIISEWMGTFLIFVLLLATINLNTHLGIHDGITIVCKR